MFPVGDEAFHNLKYICPKFTQSTLLNILQLCILTNQFTQPHSQSLNKYFCKGIGSPPPPRCHKAYFYFMAEGNLSLHCKKNLSENKSLFRIPIPPTVFSISVVQNLCSSPLSFFKIIEVGKITLTLLMETNSISLSKKFSVVFV